MLLILTISTSVILQFIAAAMVLRLIKDTKHKTAWIFISISLSLMAIRRCFSLYNIIHENINSGIFEISEIIALIVSVFMLIGIIFIRRHFRDSLKSQKYFYDYEIKNYSDKYHSQELLLHNILNNTLVGIVTISSNGIIISINKAIEKMFGYDAKELVGHNLNIIMNEPDKSKHDEYIKNYFTTNIPKIIGIGREIIGKKKDSKLIHLQLAVNEFEMNGNKYFTGFLLDISENIYSKKIINEINTFTQTILDSSAYSIISTDSDGIIVNFNNAAEKLLGYNANELAGKETPLAIHDIEEVLDRKLALENEFGISINNLFDVFILKSKNGAADEREWTYIRRDGKRIPVFLSVSELKDISGNVLGYVGIANDISDRKKYEFELKKAKEEAIKANNAKSEFLANMSHEIRTPMNAILGFSELLKNNITDEKQKGYLDGIIVSGKNLLKLINDILDLSKIEAGKLEISLNPVNPFFICNEIKQIFSLKIIEKGLNFELNINPLLPNGLMLDETRLRQILVNIVGNAIKFTSEGYIRITVDFEGETKIGSSINLKFEIEDTGIGIAKDQTDMIFQAFKQQEGQSTKKYEGTGLGLTITKRLIEMMDGEIFVETKVNKGTKFTFIIKNVKVTTFVMVDDNPEKDISNIEFFGSKILLAEDIETNRIVTKGFLETHKLLILEANNGKEAYEMAKLYLPDLILMDIHMPILDGYRASELIKNDSDTKEIPIIALTAAVMKNEIDKINIFCDSYLQKPVSKTDLIFEISKFLKHRLTNSDLSESNIKSLQDEVISFENIDKDLIKLLSLKYKNTIEELKQTMVINEIIDFADDIISDTIATGDNEVLKLGKALKTSAEQFKIEKLNHYLDILNTIFKIKI